MGESSIIVYVPPILFGLVSLTFFVLWQQRIVTNWQWGAGFGQTALGFSLSTFPIQPVFDALASGMIFIGAAYCYSSAVFEHFQQRSFDRERQWFVGLYTLLLIYCIFVLESLRYQLFLTDIAFACLVGLALIMAVPKVQRGVDKVLLASISLAFVDTVARAVYFFFFYGNASDDFGDFVDSAYNLAVHITTITICMTFPFSALVASGVSAMDRHRQAAERDPLTGLLNRRGFEAAVTDPGASGLRDGAVLVCDIDHFKRINDTLGHATGDAVISAIADLLRHVTGRNAVTARFGGEEFVIFLPGATLSKARPIAEQIRQSVAEKDWRFFGLAGPVTVSIGIDQPRSGDSDLYSAIARADRALYAAKAAGRNRVFEAEENGAFGAPAMASV
ncbi:GGDEF domain-containing protein [Rhizobium sp. AQ_MP]|uniref:diguanylate cyclase n=1 Tax=Rhizobium sp. AQ_MP TaxID=2761536 RepID=UPI00163B199C|nr:GGDEF domain-containing protein [Rhizobium sp. AQ_MP]